METVKQLQEQLREIFKNRDQGLDSNDFKEVTAKLRLAEIREKTEKMKLNIKLQNTLKKHINKTAPLLIEEANKMIGQKFLNADVSINHKFVGLFDKFTETVKGKDYTIYISLSRNYGFSSYFNYRIHSQDQQFELTQYLLNYEYGTGIIKDIYDNFIPYKMVNLRSELAKINRFEKAIKVYQEAKDNLNKHFANQFVFEYSRQY